MTSIFDSLLNAKRRKALEGLAREDFERARGTQHARLLVEASERLEKQISVCRNQVRQLENEKSGVESKTREQLQLVLESYLVNQHLREVSGIGDKLRQNIIAHVFRGRIADLRKASLVPGIGENRQIAINQWVSAYERQIPKLLLGDFPGKKEIISQASAQSERIIENIKRINLDIDRLDRILIRATTEINRLKQVTSVNFVQARLNPTEENPKVLAYFNGSFPEWEPMPDWFKEIISTK